MTAVLKLPLKRAVGLVKGVRLSGDASIHWRATVRGPGRVLLEPGARIGPAVHLDLRGGRLLMRAGSSIPHSAIVRVGGSVELGRESVVMHYTVIYGEGGVTLGDRVLVGNHCLISSTAHRYEGRTAVAGQGMREAAVIIADEAWIGAFTIVDPGVRIGRGAIVGAHSYVKEDVPDYAVVAGCPAQLIRHRDGGSIS